MIQGNHFCFYCEKSTYFLQWSTFTARWRARTCRYDRSLYKNAQMRILRKRKNLGKDKKYSQNIELVFQDAIFLQNEKLMAIAQKKWTYVYDNQGTEIHCLKKTDRVNKMNYLPYHFLLASINRLSMSI